MFYVYNQNNSGGSFVIDKANGITHIVIIEADTLGEANYMAESKGIYFDGVESGLDCKCCGDRWYPPCDEKGDTEPLIYDKKPEDYVKQEGNLLWMEKGFEIAVNYKNGEIKWY